MVPRWGENLASVVDAAMLNQSYWPVFELPQRLMNKNRKTRQTKYRDIWISQLYDCNISIKYENIKYQRCNSLIKTLIITAIEIYKHNILGVDLWIQRTSHS